MNNIKAELIKEFKNSSIVSNPYGKSVEVLIEEYLDACAIKDLDIIQEVTQIILKLY